MGMARQYAVARRETPSPSLRAIVGVRNQRREKVWGRFLVDGQSRRMDLAARMCHGLPEAGATVALGLELRWVEEAHICRSTPAKE